jgi:hypothetical protein
MADHDRGKHELDEQVMKLVGEVASLLEPPTVPVRPFPPERVERILARAWAKVARAERRTAAGRRAERPQAPLPAVPVVSVTPAARPPLSDKEQELLFLRHVQNYSLIQLARHFNLFPGAPVAERKEYVRRWLHRVLLRGGSRSAGVATPRLGNAAPADEPVAARYRSS